MKRLLPFIILIFLFLAGIFYVPFLLNPEKHRAEITDALTKFFKRPVVIGPMSMGYFPPTLRLGEVAVMKDGGNPALHIDAVLAPLDVSALFHFKLLPADLQLNHWVLIILRKADGTWDLRDWFSGSSTASAAPKWPIHQVSWKAGEIHWSDPYASVPQELVLGSLEGNWDPKLAAITTKGAFSGPVGSVTLSFNAKGQFLSSPQWTGDMQLSDQGNALTVHLEQISDVVDAKAGAPKWSASNAVAFLKFYGRGAGGANSLGVLTLDNWQFHVHDATHRVIFEHSAGISGGLSEGKGTIDPSPAGPLVHFQYAVKDIPVQALLGVVGQNVPLDGKLTGLAKDVELVISTATLGTLKGQGYWELKDANYKLPDVSMQKLAKAKIMPYVKQKFPDLSAKGLSLSKLAAHWQAKDGIASIDDGLVVSTDLKAGWAGKLDAAKQGIDAYLRIQLHEKNSKLAHLIPEKYRSQPAFGHLQGTWQEWTLRQTTKIPSAVQAKLRKAIR